MAEITQTPTTSMPHTMGRKALTILRELVLMIVVVLVATVLTRATVENIAVGGISMEPTLYAAERVLVNKGAYWLRSPQRGDVIIATEPEYQGTVVKRIIGLPGDELVVEGDKTFVNGQLLNEPYVPSADFVPATFSILFTPLDITKDGRWLVPEGHYFLLGDDRNFSADSRTFGPVTADAIRGKVQLLVWPPERWDIVAHHRDYGIAAD